jgi:prophage DNA circulation protein
VESSTDKYGRRIVVHEFPLRDAPFIEDLGEKARTYDIEGYLSGGDWMDQRDALIAASTSGGLSTLVHPFYSRDMICALKDISFDNRLDSLGKVRFTASFVEQNDDLGAGEIVALAASLFGLEGAVFSAISALVSAVPTVWSIASAADFVVSGSIDLIRSWAALFDGTFRLTLGLGTSSALLRKVEQLYSDAPALAANPSDLTGRVSAIFDAALDTDAAAASDVADAMARIYDYGSDASRVKPESASDTIYWRNSIALNDALRRAVVAAYCLCVARRPFGSQQEALSARNRMIRVLEREALLMDEEEPDVIEAWTKMRTRAIEAFTISTAYLKPAISVTSPQLTTSLFMATKIYADPERSTEIWERNGATHPCLIGTSIEVLAR